jgi:hypothetical protein
MKYICIAALVSLVISTAGLVSCYYVLYLPATKSDNDNVGTCQVQHVSESLSSGDIHYVANVTYAEWQPPHTQFKTLFQALCDSDNNQCKNETLAMFRRSPWVCWCQTSSSTLSASSCTIVLNMDYKQKHLTAATALLAVTTTLFIVSLALCMCVLVWTIVHGSVESVLPHTLYYRTVPEI